MHPQMEILILYHDQLNAIATYVAEIKDNKKNKVKTIEDI